MDIIITFSPMNSSSRISISSSHETLADPELPSVNDTPVSETKKLPKSNEVSSSESLSFVDWDGPDDPENPQKCVAKRCLLSIFGNLIR